MIWPYPSERERDTLVALLAVSVGLSLGIVLVLWGFREPRRVCAEWYVAPAHTPDPLYATLVSPDTTCWRWEWR